MNKKKLIKDNKKLRKALRKLVDKQMEEKVVIDVETRPTGSCSVTMSDSEGLSSQDNLRPGTVQRWTIFGEHLRIVSVWPVDDGTVCTPGEREQEAQSESQEVGGHHL